MCSRNWYILFRKILLTYYYINNLANPFHHISFRYLAKGNSFRNISFNFKMRNKKHWNLPDLFNYSSICTHNFSFHTMSLYFLFHMSYNSSYLRTNSINFSSISEDNQAALIASKHSKRSGGDVINDHVTRIEQVQSGSDPFRHVKYSRSARATGRKRDV